MIARISIDELTPETVSRHGVVALSVGMPLAPEGLLELARRMGRPEGFVLPKYRPADFPPEVTLLDSQGDGVTSAGRGFGQGWHQDSTYLENPPQYTLLHSHEVPDEGGDTFFADTRPALDALSGEDRLELEGLTLEHSVRESYKVSAKDAGRTLEEIRASLPSARHPAVHFSPRSGACLWLSPLYTTAVLPAVARPVYERALREVVKTKAVHKWKAGEVLVWDNRVVLHAASGYSGTKRRRLIRTMARDDGRLS
jgi:taurine dioxygenase